MGTVRRVQPERGATAAPIELIGAFESTYQPMHDVDVAETTGHIGRWQDDLALLRSCGVRRLRYPVRWHRVESEPGRYDWATTDVVLGHLREAGMAPIVDLVHHTSYPRWLDGGFADPGFATSYLRYVEAFARRYPWIDGYTLFNEPFTTFFLCGQEAIWPPYLSGLEGFVRLATNVFPAVAAASRACRDLLPDARHLYVDTCERHSAASSAAEAYTAFANDRRFFLLDLFLGRPLDPERPFVAELRRAGVDEELLAMEPGHVDVLGLDYYAHCQWQFFDDHGTGIMSSPTPAPLADLVEEYWGRYRLPCVLGETNIRGYPSDRASWLKYTLEQCEVARRRGVPLEGYCWFPFVDSSDWDSLLSRCTGSIDPVGVYWLDDVLARRPSSMSAAYRLAAGGASASELPAYRFQPPVDQWLAGWMPHMAHWEWRDPPSGELVERPPSTERIELRIVEKGP